MANPQSMMKSGLGMTSPTTLIQEVSSHITVSTTDRLLLPPWQTHIMITPEMSHQLWHRTHDGIDLHLGQKPKLGGRYTDITHSFYISYSVGTLYIHVSFSFFLFGSFLLCCCFSKRKKTKNISVVSLCFLAFFKVSSFSLLSFNLSCYSKIQKHLALLLVSFYSLFQNSKTQKYFFFFFCFVKFAAGCNSLP